jgi:predicted  nucleic acid-binding Zn-ribbon protein
MKITDVGAALDPQFERVEWRKKMSYAEDENYDGYDLEEDAETFKQVSQLERKLADAQAEIVRLKGEAESWEKVFDRTCGHLADAKTALAEAVAKERERCALVCERSVTAPAGTYQILMAAAKEIRKGEKEYLTVEARKPVPEFELIEKWEGE